MSTAMTPTDPIAAAVEGLLGLDYWVVGERRDGTYLAVASFADTELACRYAKFLASERPVVCKAYVVFDRKAAKTWGVVPTRHLEEGFDGEA